MSCLDLFVRITKSILTDNEYIAEEIAETMKCTVNSIEKKKEYLLREDEITER